MGKIFINGLEFYAFHGYFEEEQKIGGKYLVDIELETDFFLASTQDKLEGTINYAEVANEVNEVMKVKSKLIEHVAERIIEKLLNKFANVEFIKVKLSKLNPPMGYKLKSVSVELEKTRKFK